MKDKKCRYCGEKVKNKYCSPAHYQLFRKLGKKFIEKYEIDLDI